VNKNILRNASSRTFQFKKTGRKQDIKMDSRDKKNTGYKRPSSKTVSHGSHYAQQKLTKTDSV
jgi:hypothetical protein